MNFMGPASLGLEIDIFGDFIYSVLLLNLILGLIFLRVSPIPTQVLAAQGPAGLLTGLSVTVVMESARAVYICTFVGMKRFLTTVLADGGATQPLPLHATMLAGSVAGCAGWLSIYPLDLARSALQAHPPWCEKQDDRETASIWKSSSWWCKRKDKNYESKKT